MNSNQDKQSKVVEYLRELDGISTHSMFGGIGYFQGDAMFLLVYDGKTYLRGGGELSEQFRQYQCQQFAFQKRIGCARVEYFEIDDLFDAQSDDFEVLLKRSLAFAHQDKDCRGQCRRLRDLPNLQLSIERMLVRVGVCDIETLNNLGAACVFVRLKQIYGQDLSLNLLWKLEGALRQIHYTLLDHRVKNQLVSQINRNQLDSY
ncbi:TfoX/Sxy family DNA transformation protein [Vibrio ishigakensis]|uniref:TfoX/Sxy family DNA transformation protein n=1 Tax=Vibrio ishigakensis TaxID=1481914 RepID=UPI0021C3E98C|nr:TfoX/Sxy family DNA transformation protein [Vibrio ishigakensis]